MRSKKFIDKANVGLCMLLAVTGAYSLGTFKFHATPFFSIKTASAQTHSAALQIENWWPIEGARVQGVVPFKGLLKDYSVTQYNMYWKVDEGNLVPMDTNYTDFPHKEAAVHVSNWKWKGQGPYKITFVARSVGGELLSEKSFNIYNTTAASSQSPVPSVTLTSSAPQPAPTISTNINVWWPTNNANLSGVQPLKAVAEGLSLKDYRMYWQVDGGSFNLMSDSYDGYPHKEVSVDLSGWKWKGTGPYTLTFTARNLSGQTLSTKNITIFVQGSAPGTAPVVTSTTSAPVPATTDPSPTQTQPVSNPVAGNPLSGLKLYVDPNNPAASQASAWRSSRPYDASLMDKIATQPIGMWLGGWSGDITTTVRNAVSKASAQGAAPTFIAYNIPSRDCGSYSAGGINSPDGYRNWIMGIKNGIGNNKAVVILEPDALPGITCLSQNDQNTRYALLRDAVTTLKSNPNTIVYIDAGHSNWIAANDMSNRLRNAGIDKADGFSLNVSNFFTTSANASYGTTLSGLLGNKHFVIDTSRNGNGANGEWCNPSGRALGQRPTTSTGNPLIDAYLWLKQPGESDGSCNGAPSAGTWWPEYALGLAQRAAY